MRLQQPHMPPKMVLRVRFDTDVQSHRAPYVQALMRWRGGGDLIQWLDSMGPVSRHLHRAYEYDNVPGESAEDARAYLETRLRETPEGRRLLANHLHSSTLWAVKALYNNPDNIVEVGIQDAILNAEHWQREDRLAALLQLEGVLPRELAGRIARLL
jgi:hypothetical protein